ncbi:MAG: hypothetical protein NT074_02955 [Methanomicrobiales archaeon]|nr:hypothetical protein [Methanomicrobiales archaeon]
MMQDTATFLELVDDVKISELIKCAGNKRCEASGVHLKDGYLHIIFDDDSHLLRLKLDWRQAGEEPVLLELKGTAAGYEDITYQSSTNRWYCLIETAEMHSGIFMPRIDEFDESFTFIKSYWLNFPFKTSSKGFEGLSILRYAGNDYLLGLCEGNKCKSGNAGIEPGKGRIQVFKLALENWEHVGTIRLPKTVLFKDYSSLDFCNGCLTVISQSSSAMWVGRLRAEPAGFEDLLKDDGELFLFPHDEKDRIMYCNLEGVTWLGNDRLVVVSDKAKSDQSNRCARKEQSIHIFKLSAVRSAHELNRYE